MTILLFVLCVTHAVAQNRQMVARQGMKALEVGNKPLAVGYFEDLIKRWNSLLDEEILDYPFVMSSYEWVDKKSPNDSVQDVSQTPDFYSQILYQLVKLCHETRQYTKAEKYCTMLVESDSANLVSDSQYWLGQSFMLNGKYREAVDAFKVFLAQDNITEKQRNSAENFKKGSIMAFKDLKLEKEQISVAMAEGGVNSGVSTASISYLSWNNSENQFLVSKSMRSKMPGETESYRNHYDVFNISKSTTEFTRLSPMGVINSDANEGAATVMPENASIIFMRQQANGLWKIYVSNFSDTSWLEPREMNSNVNMEGTSSMYPHYDFEDQRLYFASDRQGGEGKFDIWYCNLDDKGNPGIATNAGQVINTPEDELTTFMHQRSRVLYFSSSGHIGMGGQDIFKSYYRKGAFGEPENLKHPVNSCRNEMFYILDRYEMQGFFTSDRDVCSECPSEGCMSVYSMKLNINILLSGKVLNSITDEPVANATVELKFRDDNNESPVTVTTDESGSYSFELIKDTRYSIGAAKKDFYSQNDTLHTMAIRKSTNMILNLYLLPATTEEIVMEGILYDFDKWDLLTESKVILNTLVNIMYKYPMLTIELASHTDNRGSDDYNQILSQKRAESCVEYLIRRGIQKERLVAIGYGETKPLVENAEKEEDHQLNRRTTFRILSNDFGVSPGEGL